jgi:hypothetical protein
MFIIWKIVDEKVFRKNRPSASMVDDAYNPYHPFPSSLQAIISTEFLNVRMMKGTIHLFLFWSTSKPTKSVNWVAKSTNLN